MPWKSSRLLKQSSLILDDMGVSKNKGTPKSSILIGFGTIINHPFWDTPIFGNTHKDSLLKETADLVKTSSFKRSLDI